MPKENSKKALDRVRRKRGPKPRVVIDHVIGRSPHYRGIFQTGDTWERLWPRLGRATNAAAVAAAFEDALPGVHEFKGLEGLILRVLREKRFPKKMRAKQINFLADSLAGRGYVSPRRSRDICEAQRRSQRAKSTHHIKRIEFYIECSCGYDGPSRDCKCRKCGAEIDLGNYFGFGLF